MCIRLFYILLYLFTVVESNLDIRDANVATLDRDAVGLIFFVTVENTNNCPYQVKVGMIDCAEIISPNDVEHNFMFLMGGNMGTIKPRCFKNLTLIYPNMYLHNRRGFCLISIKFRGEKDDLVVRKANITFDTYLNRKVVSHVLRGFYHKSEVSRCKTVDQDPLKRCTPVDCHMKYLGTRNFFNKGLQRCQKVPACVADPNKELPDIIYSTGTNQCRDLEKAITKHDLQVLDTNLLLPQCGDESYLSTLNINCHFGKFNNVTAQCDCFDGWTSSPLNKDHTPAQGLIVYHMCNIEATDWYDTDSRKIKLICLIVGMLAIILAIAVVLCSFLIQLCYNCIKSFEYCEGKYCLREKKKRKHCNNPECRSRRAQASSMSSKSSPDSPDASTTVDNRSKKRPPRKSKHAKK